MSGHENAAEVMVVGAGVVGCSVARALALRGVGVTVVDPEEPGSRATRAAGGMLSPLGEAEGPGPFLKLGLESLRLYPEFVAAVEEEADAAVDFLASGKLQVAVDGERLARLRRRKAWLDDAGFPARWLDGDEIRRREGALAPSLRGGILLDDERQVDNRLLGRALWTAAGRAGVRFRIGRSVTRLVRRDGEVGGVELDDGSEVASSSVVLAAGAWSGTVEGLPGALPVRPVRGQMVALEVEPGTLDTIVETGRVYLIPRRGGPLLVGATQEEAGFRDHTTAGGVSRLLRGALEALPGLEDARIVERWSGLRPGTPDEMPILGADPDLPGLFHASGHFRNGILLAPITARILEGHVLDEADILPPIDLAPFRPGRFRPQDSDAQGPEVS